MSYYTIGKILKVVKKVYYSFLLAGPLGLFSVHLQPQRVNVNAPLKYAWHAMVTNNAPLKYAWYAMVTNNAPLKYAWHAMVTNTAPLKST